MRATSIGHAGILVETTDGSILCDPWFVPAFQASWFVFPRNDRLPAALMERVEHPDFLYISHIHGDHLDEEWLGAHVDRSTTVLLPGFSTGELERRLRDLGFENFVHTRDGEELTVQDAALPLFEQYTDARTAAFARRHRDVIARFGRFPHRNAALGRDSSAEERAFLQRPGSRF